MRLRCWVNLLRLISQSHVGILVHPGTTHETRVVGVWEGWQTRARGCRRVVVLSKDRG